MKFDIELRGLHFDIIQLLGLLSLTVVALEIKHRVGHSHTYNIITVISAGF